MMKLLLQALSQPEMKKKRVFLTRGFDNLNLLPLNTRFIMPVGGEGKGLIVKAEHVMT